MVTDLTGAKLLLSPSDLPRHRCSINELLCCDWCSEGFELCTCNREGLSLCKPKFKDKNSSPVYCHVANHVSFAGGLPQKKGVNPDHQRAIKSVKGVSCVNQLSSVQNVTNVPPVLPNLPVGARLHQFWKKMGSPRRQPQSTSSPQRRLHTSLPVPAQFDKKSHNNKLLCKSSQEQLPVGGIASAVRQKCCRIGSKSTVSGLLKPVSSGTQTQQPVATYLRPEYTEQLLKKTVVQNGDSRDYKDLPPGRGVGDLHRFQRHILPYTNKQPVQEVHVFSYPGQDLSIQSTALWSVHSPHGVYSGGQRGQISGNEKGYKNPPVPRRLVGQGQIPPNLSAWLVNKDKSELEPKQVFNFVGYQFDLKEDRIRPTAERLQTLQSKIRKIMSSPVCPVRNLMSLIGLLTSTEKQVHLGRLHVRPIQWHLKNNWRVPETMERQSPFQNHSTHI